MGIIETQMPRRRKNHRKLAVPSEAAVTVDIESADTAETVAAKMRDLEGSPMNHHVHAISRGKGRGLHAQQFAALPRQHDSLRSQQLQADIDVFYEKHYLCFARGNGRCGVYALLGHLLHGFRTQTQVETALTAAAGRVGMDVPRREGTW